MRMITTSLLDYITSAARESMRPTLVVQTSNEGGDLRIDTELDMLTEEAREALKADGIAIVEFKFDSDLERIYERVSEKSDADTSPLGVVATMIPSSGRTKTWKTARIG